LTDSLFTLNVRITTRSAQDKVLGWATFEREQLLVRVTAPPADGLANAALIRILAESLDIPKSSVSLIRGFKAKEKVLSLRVDTNQYHQWKESIPVRGEE